MPVETVVGDVGTFSVRELGTLQESGLPTAVADPVRNRQIERLSEPEGRGVQTGAADDAEPERPGADDATRGTPQADSRHVLDYGGARRTTLRGRENILKRYLVRTLCVNLRAPLRHTARIRTLKRSWTGSTATVGALIGLFTALSARTTGSGWADHSLFVLLSSLRRITPTPTRSSTVPRASASRPSEASIIV